MATQEEILKLAQTIKEGDLLKVSFDDRTIQSTVTAKAELGTNGKDLWIAAAAFYADKHLVVIEFGGYDVFRMAEIPEDGQLGRGIVGLEIIKQA